MHPKDAATTGEMFKWIKRLSPNWWEVWVPDPSITLVVEDNSVSPPRYHSWSNETSFGVFHRRFQDQRCSSRAPFSLPTPHPVQWALMAIGRAPSTTLMGDNLTNCRKMFKIRNFILILSAYWRLWFLHAFLIIQFNRRYKDFKSLETTAHNIRLCSS